MAHPSQNGPGSLEDSVRQTLISSGSSGTSALFDNNTASQPAVRLPPITSYASDQKPHSNVGPPHLRRQQQQHSSYGNRPAGDFPQNGNYPPPHSPSQQRGPYQTQPPHGNRGNHRQQQSYNAAPPPNMPSPGPQQRSRIQQQMQLDPNAFRRGELHQSQPQRPRGGRAQYLFNPHQPRGPMPSHRDQQHVLQSQYLDHIASMQISKIDMPSAEFEEKETFRVALDNVVRQVCAEHADRLPKTSLEAFGSFKSGYATAGSDMDLVIVVQDQSSSAACFSLLEDDLPRVLEKRLLDLGYGARLLTRTRVPIIKVCEKPGTDLLENLRKEREKWNALSEKEKYPHLYPEAAAEGELEDAKSPVGSTASDGQDAILKRRRKAKDAAASTTSPISTPTQETPQGEPSPLPNGAAKPPAKRDEKPWTRERKAGPLDFPSTGVGIHCDVNFFNPLGLHNTQLLRCYSLCDTRVRPIILFVKAWAKARKINSSYSGTLSSYGYVLMVLHYLVNVARPPVLPNLQNETNPFGHPLPDAQQVDNWPVRFWRDELSITPAAARGQLTQNRASVGSLLAGFFHYYSSLGGGRTYHWMQSVLSLRSPGGVLTKEEKGWVRAVTEEGEGKKIQHRYLFCIEDPFELEHNVARTVTHKGIVAVRDEFRRAHRILLAVGYGESLGGEELCTELIETPSESKEKEGGAHKNGTQAQFAGIQMQPHHQNLDLRNQAAFPSLAPGATKAAGLPKKKGGHGPPTPAHHDPSESGDFGEISGDKAKLYLEEVRRKRDEAAAESTARFAAESVLEGM